MALGSINPQLVLKTMPPRIPKTVAERPRLSSLRPEFADKAVVAVEAAAGCGKTSLLSQWRKEALQSGAVVAWLTLDNRDTDSRLVLGLAASMRSASGRPNFGQACMRAAGDSEGSLEGITEWLAEAADLAVETVLILDDLHTLPDATLQSALIYLLLNAPANLRVVLASRKPVELPLSELPARGRFARITASELRFDLSETVNLLQARFGKRIDLDSSVRLYELTEGWPLGVQLAISAIERSPDLPEAIAGLSVRSGDIHRYFVESLVDHLPAEAAEFLVSVSFVDALSPSLCEAITQRADAGQMLKLLQESTPIFSEGLDGGWLRIHPLAREFLAGRFAQLPEAERRTFHARAARWLDAHEQCEEAARQMLEAGQADTAYALVERCLHDVLNKGQVAAVADWVERLPPEEILRRTSLRLTVGWILAQSKRHAEAAQLVGALIDDPAVDAGDRCESAEICGTAALFADDIDGMGGYVSSWYDTLPNHSMLRYLVGINQLAFMTLYRGAPEQARFTYRDLPADDASAGRYTLGWRDWIIGISYLWEGQVDLAAEKLRPALARAEDDSGRRSPIAVTLASALATAQWERNHTDDARALLANRLDVLESRAPPDAIIMGYVTAARAAALGGSEQRVLDLLDNLFALGESRHLPRLCIAALAERIRFHAVRGRGDVCAVVERKLDDVTAGLRDHPWGVLGPVIELQTGLARAFAAAARHEWLGMLGRLDELAPLAERLRRGREGVQIYLLRAVATGRRGLDAKELLESALSTARMWGLQRILEDTHPDLAVLSGHVPRERLPPAGAAVAANVTSLSAARVRVARSSLLSPREREVLRLLAGSLSNKQIALAMGVSDETVKWHLKNLFSKLNAASREHLLHRARMVGILDTVA